jgi:FkbM family methyltransferase
MTRETSELRAPEVADRFLELARVRGISAPIICDIGSRDASEGIFLLEALKGKQLHVFEPNPAAAALCRSSLEKLKQDYGQDQIFFNEIAVSDRVGEARFFPVNAEKSANKDIGFSSLYRVNPKYTKRRGQIVQDEIVVQTTTLDNYFAGRPCPDILWIDVEGAELQVFRGARSVLAKVTLIHVEVSFRAMHLGKPLFWEVDSFLRTCGMKFLFFVETSLLKGFLYRYKLLPNVPWRLNAVYCRTR